MRGDRAGLKINPPVKTLLLSFLLVYVERSNGRGEPAIAHLWMRVEL